MSKHVLPAVVAVALVALTASGTATPAEQSSPVRIVVGYQSSRGPAAATLERLLGTEPVTAIPKLDVHVVSV
ncbi:MAG: hypothetical protein WBB76_11900, partial [Gaiellaceae bacterium]